MDTTSNKNYCNRLQQAPKEDNEHSSLNDSGVVPNKHLTGRKKSITNLKVVRISKSVAGFYPETIANTLAHTDVDQQFRYKGNISLAATNFKEYKSRRNRIGDNGPFEQQDLKF